MFDFLIFRRLWGIPASGLAALIKKRIANEVVIGYSGEAYFYAWARARAQMVAAPFGAVKDVSILSAIAGNAVTLALIAVALPLGRRPDRRPSCSARCWASAGDRTRRDLAAIPDLLATRLLAAAGPAVVGVRDPLHPADPAVRCCCALAWHFALPDVSIAMWLFLAAGRLLVSRLPLVPNKDLLFANFAILLIGQEQALSELIAFSAAAVVARPRHR